MTTIETAINPSWSNPIWHRGWRIYAMQTATGFAYVHDDYDGAPDSGDNRFGYAQSVEAAKDEIDETEAV